MLPFLAAALRGHVAHGQRPRHQQAACRPAADIEDRRDDWPTIPPPAPHRSSRARRAIARQGAVAEDPRPAALIARPPAGLASRLSAGSQMKWPTREAAPARPSDDGLPASSFDAFSPTLADDQDHVCPRPIRLTDLARIGLTSLHHPQHPSPPTHPAHLRLSPPSGQPRPPSHHPPQRCSPPPSPDLRPRRPRLLVRFPSPTSHAPAPPNTLC